MSFTNDEVKEFQTEAHELLDSAEKSLLGLDRGEGLPAHYNIIFRAFHSIKGAASMMAMGTLQAHVHHLETILTEQKENAVLERHLIELFLRGCDRARDLLEGRDVADLEAPVAPTSAAAETPVQAAQAVPPPVLPVSLKLSARDKVLVIDDEFELVELATAALQHAGFDVFGTTEPQLIRQHLESFHPDVILTDIKMPVLDGLGVLKQVNAFNPDLPVIFLSGHVTKDLLMESIAIGVYGVLEKPVDSVRVVELCLNAARKSHLTRMLNRSLKLLMYQFSDLDDFLKSQGKNDIRRVIQTEIDSLLTQRRELRTIRKTAA